MAAGTYFLQLEGIEGQSADTGHDKWLDLISFAHGVTQNISIQQGGDVAGRGQFAPFTFTHAVDKATPKIQLYCMNGTRIGKAKLEYIRSVNQKNTAVYEVTLENVRVAKAAIRTIDTGDPLSQQPVETVDLVAGKITWKAVPLKENGDPDGSIEAAFNQIANK